MDHPYYEIVTGVNTQNLADKVNEKRELGYVTTGGVAILPSAGMGATFYQAMVKESKLVSEEFITESFQEILQEKEKEQREEGAMEEPRKRGRPKSKKI